MQQEVRSMLKNSSMAYDNSPDTILMNGKGSYLNGYSKAYESFTVTKGTKLKMIFPIFYRIIKTKEEALPFIY